ncbi:MAG: choloylglycine hydrolase [Clostridia bacterium]|nr:choloylglycine hydrolase [Clostridia bacterium]
MCTAVTYKTECHYFGRNLDLERSYNERVVITPRNYKFYFRCEAPVEHHYAMIGMATVVDGYPLYYEATNEKGLSMAGLNFPGNADYKPYTEGKTNITPFEFIPWILGLCANVSEAREALYSFNPVSINFSDELPLSPLHWIISDRDESMVVECVGEGVKIYDAPLGVLTNNPTYDYHMTNIANYMSLHEGAAENRLSKNVSLSNHSLGTGAIGLPGDYTTASRFVRAAFVRSKSPKTGDEKQSVAQFFHILGSVAMPLGCVMTPDGQYEYTRYSCCCNTDKCIYYYRTYENSALTQVSMDCCDIDGKELYVSETIS